MLSTIKRNFNVQPKKHFNTTGEKIMDSLDCIA